MRNYRSSSIQLFIYFTVGCVASGSYTQEVAYLLPALYWDHKNRNSRTIAFILYSELVHTVCMCVQAFVFVELKPCS